jgi:hypothetical protein
MSRPAAAKPTVVFEILRICLSFDGRGVDECPMTGVRRHPGNGLVLEVGRYRSVTF